ncbi:uncharacterized protein FIESC28_05968 [Fusarium coffeatum]|uniref:Uncharacterized protein n=1 Tax=Fusarium coffeatum TaxID=231269 RepID=A0A366RQ70_9HYPO|nr:uncharacterized protein FIESC28_05968 [Fusarium coffeatum]RBR18616.1 hypothetical protein FIESC28_05968 [Fusarium coffeatum]
MKIFKVLWGLVHIGIFVAVSVVTLIILSKSENEKKGIFELSFGSAPSIRSLPGPLQDAPFPATKIVEGVDDIANYATTLVVEATRVAGDVKDKASSAIAAAETFAAGFIPKGCSFGTKYMCIDLKSGFSECTAFPVDHKVPWDQLASSSDVISYIRYDINFRCDYTIKGEPPSFPV